MKLPFFSKDDGHLAPSIKYIGIPFTTAALAILGVPGFSAALIHFLNNTFQLHLDFNQSPKAGWAFLVLGVGDFVVEGILSACRASPFLALRHESFSPISSPLHKTDLPLILRGRKIEESSCDLHTFMPNDLEVAVRVQAAWARKAEALRSVLRAAPVGYYGIVHVPFQFLAGYMFSSFISVNLFELNRSNGKWITLSDSDGPSLSAAANITGDLSAQDVAIRIGISYAVLPDQIAAVMPSDFADVSLTIGSPRIDAITTYRQVRELCSMFRSLLDDPRVRGKNKHIFYAGPVSLGFALGQRISSTIHGQVNVYNFNANSPVKYPWSLRLGMQEQDIHVRRF